MHPVSRSFPGERWTLTQQKIVLSDMNHKRRRPRNARAGCKLCKPWKANGFHTEAREGEKFSHHR